MWKWMHLLFNKSLNNHTNHSNLVLITSITIVLNTIDHSQQCKRMIELIKIEQNNGQLSYHCINKSLSPCMLIQYRQGERLTLTYICMYPIFSRDPSRDFRVPLYIEASLVILIHHVSWGVLLAGLVGRSCWPCWWVLLARYIIFMDGDFYFTSFWILWDGHCM